MLGYTYIRAMNKIVFKIPILYDISFYRNMKYEKIGNRLNLIIKLSLIDGTSGARSAHGSYVNLMSI